MIDLLFILIIFFVSVILHLFWCRYHNNKKMDLVSFGLIAFVGLAVYFYATPFIKDVFIREDTLNFWNMPLKLSSVILYFFLIPTYLVFYSNTHIFSPSRKTLLAVKEKGEVSYEDILKEVTDEEFIVPRIKDLVRTHFVDFDGTKYKISKRGILVAKILNLYQKILGREIGG